MPNFGTFIGWHEDGDLEAWYRQFNRADSVRFMMGHRGVELTLARGASNLAVQTALISLATRTTETTGQDGSKAAKVQLLIVGDDQLDIQRGDRFKYPTTMTRLNYQVERVEHLAVGMTQAFAEEIQ